MPIALEGKALGALGVTLPYHKDRGFEAEVKFFSLAAALVAHSLRVERLVELERQRLSEENKELRQELSERHQIGNLICSSRPMQQVYQQVTQVAPSSTTVLIRDESGTGKELVAHAIHYGSPRQSKPFVKVSCAELPESLIESELFGYEPGAFTDARALKKGRFELAHGINGGFCWSRFENPIWP